VPAKRAKVEARAGKNSFPPTPFLFARPSEFFSKVSVWIFAEKSSDFNQKRQHLDNALDKNRQSGGFLIE